MLADEGRHLHALPEQPWTSAFGETRVVGLEQPTIVLDGCLYSVPWRLGGETVWVRRHGSAVIVTHVGPQGPVEVARHEETTPGSPRIDDAHFPPPPEGSLRRTPVAGTEAEAEFLAIGEGAARWLIAAGAAGASRVRVRMAEPGPPASDRQPAIPHRRLCRGAIYRPSRRPLRVVWRRSPRGSVSDDPDAPPPRSLGPLRGPDDDEARR